MRTRTVLTVVAAILLLPAIASAQMSSMPIIDGSKTPAQVPDAIAYHLVLIHYANIVSDPNRDPYTVSVQLRRIGLSPADTALLVPILHNYKSDHDTNTAALAQGQDYRATRDSKALAAKTLITEQLSAEGAAQFNAFVQQEKKAMRVAAH